ncbi:hypothetical protein HDV64DRAFT_261296 [Trichoderma sp. TUCIM 5745]
MVLPESTDNVMLCTSNISGRSLADIALFRYSNYNNQITVKTYLAKREEEKGQISWSPSTSGDSEAYLPFMDMSNGFPQVLFPDLNGDGRSDMIIPHADENNLLRFAMMESTGTGFMASESIQTPLRWETGARFLVLDLTGQNTTDVVQIFADNEDKITLRKFPAVVDNNQASLLDAVSWNTDYLNQGTLDWVPVMEVGSGRRNLVRIWAETVDGYDQIRSTTFSDAGDAGFRETATCSLGEPRRTSGAKYTVLPCDINADGVQDLVLACSSYDGQYMMLTYDVYLGDGHGSFYKHGDTTTRSLAVDTPSNGGNAGSFHMTNIDGSNYPSLCFVYEQAESGRFVGLAVDGQCDGTLSDVVLYPIADGLASASSPQITPIDLNGSGTGDWLIYTLENDVPRVKPVYNQFDSVTDLMRRTQNPLGMQTTISYGVVSDPSVYKPGIDWENLPIVQPGAQGGGEQHTGRQKCVDYPVIGAPNYVVTRIDHSNAESYNALPYQASISKTYGLARVNNRGRGWLGFGVIETLNETDNVLTKETYNQKWPLTGTKTRIDTSEPGGPVLKSEVATYSSTHTQRGEWRVYRTHKSQDRIDMMGDAAGIVARCIQKDYEFDKYGNIVLQTVSEFNLGRLAHRSWEKFTYTVIKGITSLMTSKKLTSKESNTAPTVYEEGDTALTLFEFDSQTAILRTVSEWRSDLGKFAVCSFEHDLFGNQVGLVDAAGLRTDITFDSLFHAYPVKMTQTGHGGVSLCEMAAFDQASGEQVVGLSPSGALICTRRDPLGRTLETWCRSATTGEQAEGSIPASDFSKSMAIVTDEALSSLLSQCRLEPQRQVSYLRLQDSAGSWYCGNRVVTFTKPGTGGSHESIELIDCVQRVRRQHLRRADDTDKTLLAWEFDARGNRTLESYPVKAPATTDAAWSPLLGDSCPGTRSKYNVLGQQVSQSRPAHGDMKHLIVTVSQHLDGGSRIRESTFAAVEPVDEVLAGQAAISTTERRFLHISGDERIVEKVDENGLCTKFSYDLAGNLLECIDPAGLVEKRRYNSLGSLISLDNQYQRCPASSNPGRPAMTYTYDIGNHMIGQINAAGQSLSFEVDARGRVMKKTGSDGRTVTYGYATDQGMDRIDSIEIRADKEDSAFESRTEFRYDLRGRTKSQTLSLADGSSYPITYEYDWQDSLVAKTMPDGTRQLNEFHGAVLSSSTLKGGSSSPWFLKASIDTYSAARKAEKITITGTSVEQPYQQEWQYDSQGFPTMRSLSAGTASLVKDQYTYNDLHKIHQKQDQLTGISTTYSYAGRRLASSSTSAPDGKQRAYSYDASGNLVQKEDTTISHTHEGDLVGSTREGSEVFRIQYDQAGRMIRRKTSDDGGGDATFSYSSSGGLVALHDANRNHRVDFLLDHEDRTLVRINADGSREVSLDRACTIRIKADETRIIEHRLYNDRQLLGSVVVDFPLQDKQQSGQSPAVITIAFADTKGSVTHRFRAQDAVKTGGFEYDGYGRICTESVGGPEATSTRSHETAYEGRYLDLLVGLLDFGARWYDPLVGRFTCPDNLLDEKLLLGTDGTNRYAFENNDPVNLVDPTGHWGFDSILGVCIGAVMIFGAIAVTIATAGTASPLLAAAVIGGLTTGGVAGITYSINHHDEKDSARFWGGFATTVAINVVIGAATGAAAAYFTPVQAMAGGVRLAQSLCWDAVVTGAKIGAATGFFTNMGNNFVERTFYGSDVGLFDGWQKAVALGALGGAAAKAWYYRASFLPKTFELSLPPNVRQHIIGGLTSPALNLGSFGLKELNEKVIHVF